MNKRKGVSFPRSKKYRQIQTLSDSNFRRLVGVKKETFTFMMKILKEAEKKQKVRGGKPNTLGIADRLLMCLEYLREYRTYFHVGQSYGVSEAASYRNCRWVEDTLIKSRKFSLPGRKELRKSDHEFEVILIDASESPVERPKKKVRYKKRVKHRNNRQKHYYSGKKKRHTLKSQIVVDKKSAKVICTDFTNGKRHDFRLFKESNLHIHPMIEVLADSGYTGLYKHHAKSRVSQKSSKKKPLSKEQKKQNKELSSQRVLNENVIGKLKRFKILADRYRNRRKRFGLRFNLITGVYNYELKL